MAASATFALKAGVWFRRARLLIVSPDSLGTACPLSGRNSTYRPVRILEAGSRQAALQATFGLHAMMIGGEVCHPAPYRNAGSSMPDHMGDTGLHDAQPAQTITVAMARFFVR